MSAVPSDTALLTEHLRYPPVNLLDDVINSVNLVGYKAVDAVENGLLGASAANLGFAPRKDESEASVEARTKDEIENGVHKFETLLSASIDKNFDKMEIYALRSIISIPQELRDWVRLRHYEGLNFILSPDAPTTESVTLQRRKQRELYRLQRLLQAEEARNAALLSQLKSLILPPTSTEPIPKAEPSSPSQTSQSQTYPAFAFLQNKADLPNSSATAPLTTTAQFALSQLPALKTLLAQLRPAVKALSEQSATSTRDPNLADQGRSYRGKRVDHVESQTRRQLELRGLELDSQGKVRDGEWQSDGRKLGKGEVESLERVVGLVRGEEMDEGL